MKEMIAAGIEVDDANDPRCRQLIAPFIARVVHHRPYVTLKWAQSADGKVAGPGGKPVRISNQRSTALVHTLRAHSDGIMIGIGTAKMDDPLLTARKVAKARPLLRVVLDSDLRLSPDSRLSQTTDLGPVLVLCSKEAAEYSGTRVPLAAMGVEICPLPSDGPGRLNLAAALSELGRRGLTHLIVEPGPTLAAAFLEQDLADRVWVIESSNRIEDASAPSAPKVNYPVATRVELDDDLLLEYLNPKSEVFFHADRSADLLDI
jgi:diaminohydroxyphosphoribosylaminopyrimidine deaminase/5-amino-6-(5-phosphoribosylamino)uracil reductase